MRRREGVASQFETCLGPFTPEAPGQSKIFRLTEMALVILVIPRVVRHVHSDSLGVDSSQVGVFKEGDEVSLGGLLKSHHGRGLETEVGLDNEECEHNIVKAKTKSMLTLKS